MHAHIAGFTVRQNNDDRLQYIDFHSTSRGTQHVGLSVVSAYSNTRIPHQHDSAVRDVPLQNLLGYAKRPEDHIQRKPWDAELTDVQLVVYA